MNITDFSNKHDTFTNKASSILKGRIISHTKYQNITIEKIEPSISSYGAGLTLVVKLENGTEKRLAVYKQTLQFFDETFQQDIEPVLNDICTSFDNYQTELKQTRELEAQKQAEIENERKLEEKKQRRIETTLKKCENIRNVGLTDSSVDWLKNNVTKIKATVPDFCEKWFVKTFGDVPHKTVDCSKKTSGGNLMKFDLSMTIHLKDTETIPAGLKSYLTPDKKIINSTPLAYNLIKNYDFNLS